MKYCFQFTLFFFISFSLRSQTIDSGASNSLDTQFANPTNLSDKQMSDAKNFVHQGIKDREIAKKCKEINNCKEENEGFPIEMMLGKAYAMMGMIGGGGGMIPQLDKKPTAEQISAAKAKPPVDGKPAKPETDKQNDWCMAMAMAYETIGGALQEHLQKKGDSEALGEGDQQLQSLISLREKHKARATTSTWQGGVYGAVTGCYVAMMASGKVAVDWKVGLRMAGAGALTALYLQKAQKHKKAVEKVQAVIDAFPVAGKNCNPWTRTACFCSEVTSKKLYPIQYQEVCVLNAGNFDTPKVALGCAALVENKVEYDKECKCKANNSCMKSNLKAYNPKFGFGTNLMDDTNKTFNLLNSGEFDQGELARAAIKQAAVASRIKIKGADKISAGPLNESQKKLAEEFSKMMPENMARIAAAIPPSSYKGGIKDSVGTASISSSEDNIKKEIANAISGNYKKGRGKDISIESDDPEFVMPKFGADAEEKSGGENDILSFTEKALSNADISHNPETPIFDIISNRYRVSGWRKLEKIEEE